MRGAGGGGADAAGVGALTPSMKVYVAPFIQLLQYHYLLYTVLSRKLIQLKELSLRENTCLRQVVL